MWKLLPMLWKNPPKKQAGQVYKRLRKVQMFFVVNGSKTGKNYAKRTNYIKIWIELNILTHSYPI